MKVSSRLAAALAAFVAFQAAAADITGEWTATIGAAGAQSEHRYVFRQSGATLIGTIRSQDGVAAISNGFINYKTITFDESSTAEGRRTVLEYTGELVSDTEIKFKRQVKGTPSTAVQFVATRVGKSP